ncbi:uncharacterized protein N7459_004532 [Penicillium hispanicum]|uniref:uncharacterized protein n=1 Tax=Penicillium hispanicum TaxID=1080232 RepID=UPI0025419146|nr:uncharacterized protein N7459_004532 [Penicillium hispanicum]KAJ5584732.1 hypothetical protein N7459_004532 [Penicillium hispanicum]
MEELPCIRTWGCFEPRFFIQLPLAHSVTKLQCPVREGLVHQSPSEEAAKDAEKPICLNCQRQGENCDYSVRLNWGGRTKRASVDSPSSQSSGYGGTIIGFADSIPTSAANTIQTPNSVSNIPADEFVNVRTRELGSPAALSPSTPAPFAVFDSPKARSESEDVVSPSQVETHSASTWTKNPPLTTSMSSTPLADYFGHSFHDSFSPAADQGVGFRSLSAFAFAPNSVSQPVSFLRNSVDTPSHLSESPNFQSDHGLERQMNNMTSQKNHSHVFSSSGGISSLLIGPHKSQVTRRDTTLSPEHDEMAFGSSHASRTESLYSLHPSKTLSTDPKDDHPAHDPSIAQIKWKAYLTNVTDNYGLDCGHPDRDLALNNDHAAIELDAVGSQRQTEDKTPLVAQNSDFTGYYAAPVPINIPRSLSPLPSSLLGNPINLMYFHHFLNHTSKMLVPHDCDNNPFMSVLPSMAMGDPNLLNLLLAYSASHRARYLGHPEPANRIAHWVSDVFPTLRVALEASPEDITDSHLATAILLLSLKIVSPGTFEVPIPWQSHLKLARDLFLACSERIARHGNKIGAFFARWLGYIDTMGALSCRQAGPPLMTYHSVLATCCGPDNHDEFGVDCFTGFTPRTGLFLIRLARLVQECDNQRFDELENFQQGWHTSADVVMEAQAVLGDIDGLSEHAHIDPDHHRGVECQDMMATEEAFRCAGLLHLHRRVLGSSPDSFPVKEALRKLTSALERMRLGASTEVCSLFPLFTAGCESRDLAQRTKLLNRFFVLEKSGMKQIQNARQLMQRCWDDKLPWVALARGEFLG